LGAAGRSISAIENPWRNSGTPDRCQQAIFLNDKKLCDIRQTGTAVVGYGYPLEKVDGEFEYLRYHAKSGENALHESRIESSQKQVALILCFCPSVCIIN
jgi:hypothetical protein